MTRFSILDAASVDDRQKWMAHWENWPDREVFAHPAYVALFCKPCQRALCAVLESDEGACVLFPFIQRPLEQENWAKGRADGASDLITPYGYGGAYDLGGGAAHAATFWEAFDAWCADHQVVTAFARLSLFDDQIIPFRGDVAEKGLNIVRRLDLDEEALWKDYAHAIRKAVNQARRAGLEVEVDLHGTRLDDFLDIYAGTMDRREASSSYYFPREFFECIIAELPGCFAFFHILSEGEVVSTELVLVSAHHIYSFLGGTRSEAFKQRPNNLLKHEVIRWGMAGGKTSFVLGGGYHPDDGIYRYKRAFAPDGAVAFKVGCRTFDAKAVEGLVEMRSARESAWSPAKDYFPPYR